MSTNEPRFEEKRAVLPAFALEVEPAYLMGVFEEAYVQETQICLVDEGHIAPELKALAAVAIWSGEIDNGGLAQWYLNKVVHLATHPPSLIEYVERPVRVLRQLGDPMHFRRYVESLRLFRDLAPAILDEAENFDTLRDPRLDAFDSRFYESGSALGQELANYIANSDGIEFLTEEPYRRYTDQLKQAGSKARSSVIDSGKGFLQRYFSKKKFSVSQFLRDQEESMQSVDLKLMNEHLSRLISRLEPN